MTPFSLSSADAASFCASAHNTLRWVIPAIQQAESANDMSAWNNLHHHSGMASATLTWVEDFGYYPTNMPPSGSAQAY